MGFARPIEEGKEFLVSVVSEAWPTLSQLISYATAGEAIVRSGDDRSLARSDQLSVLSVHLSRNHERYMRRNTRHSTHAFAASNGVTFTATVASP
jgi:hypothetical protein